MRIQTSDEEWVKYRRILKVIFGSNDIALEMWNSRKDLWVDDFQREVEILLTES